MVASVDDLVSLDLEDVILGAVAAPDADGTVARARDDRVARDFPGTLPFLTAPDQPLPVQMPLRRLHDQ
jgi:hypothetical protein